MLSWIYPHKVLQNNKLLQLKPCSGERNLCGVQSLHPFWVTKIKIYFVNMKTRDQANASKIHNKHIYLIKIHTDKKLKEQNLVCHQQNHKIQNAMFSKTMKNCKNAFFQCILLKHVEKIERAKHVLKFEKQKIQFGSNKKNSTFYLKDTVMMKKK